MDIPVKHPVRQLINNVLLERANPVDVILRSVVESDLVVVVPLLLLNANEDGAHLVFNFLFNN